MKKLGKGIAIFFLVIISLCVPVALLLGVEAICEDYNNGPKSARKHISFLTGIDVPQDAEIVYHYYQRPFQGGETIQYTIFSFKSNCAEWLEKNNFKKEENKKFREGMVSDMRWFGEEGIPKFYFPNFTGRYLLLDTSRTYFLYNNDSQALYVFYLTRKSFSYNLEDTND